MNDYSSCASALYDVDMRSVVCARVRWVVPVRGCRRIVGMRVDRATVRRIHRVGTSRWTSRLYADADKSDVAPRFANIHDALQDEDDDAFCTAGDLDGTNSCVDSTFGGPDSLLVKTLRKCLKKRSLFPNLWNLTLLRIEIVHLWEMAFVEVDLVKCTL